MATVIGFLLGGIVGFVWGYSAGGEWVDSAVYTGVMLAVLGGSLGWLFFDRHDRHE